MANKVVDKQARPILNGLAEGTIGPEPRGISGDVVDRFADALATDEAFSAVSGVVPRKCVDGRPRADGVDSLGPDAAGGTESLVIGDALTGNKYYVPGDTASRHTARVLSFWRGQGHQVGGHDAANAHGGGCGCGACDKLQESLRFIATRGADIREMIEGLGVAVDDDTHQRVLNHAQRLAGSDYADGGPAIIAAMREVDPTCVETLTGNHCEVAVVINTQPGTTLDRAKVRGLSDQMSADAELQAFNVDAWALHESAGIMYGRDTSEAHALYYAALCYNVAVAAVLSHGSLRIVMH